MYHHTALYRLKPGITLDRVRSAKDSLALLVETLPGVEHFAVVDNLADLNHGFTLVLFSTFENAQACQIFQRHPEYQRVWAELLSPVVEERIIAEGADDGPAG